MLSVRLSEAEEKRLAQLAKKTGKPRSFFVREALHLTLDYMVTKEFLTDNDRRRHQVALEKTMLEWLGGGSSTNIYIENLGEAQRQALMVRLMREHCKLTLEQASKCVGVSEKQFSTIEAGMPIRMKPDDGITCWVKKLLEYNSDGNVDQNGMSGNEVKIHAAEAKSR